MKNRYKVVPAAMITLVMILAVLWKSGIYFETNDDRYIISILSGMMTGEPDAHVVYVNYLLALPLALGYRLTLKIPWYGLTLLFFQWMAYTIILKSAYRRCKNLIQILFCTVMVAFYFLAHYYMLGLIQYTSTAVLLATAGYVCLLLHNDSKKHLFWFFFMELLAYLLRDQGMLMVQPLGFAVVFGEKIVEDSLTAREKIKQIGLILGTLIVVILIGTFGNFIGGYYQPEWIKYQKFNDSRTIMFDYYGKPSYEEVEAILIEHQISKKKYEAYCAYTILDWEAGGTCDAALEKYTLNSHKKILAFGAALGEAWKISFLENQYDMNKVIVVAWGVWIVWIIFGRKWKMALSGIGLFFSRNAVWVFLIWRGRLPLRVCVPLFACETILLLALVWRNYRNNKISLVSGSVFLCVILAFGLVSFETGQQQYRYVCMKNREQKIYIEGLKEIYKYCNGHPENRYLIEANSLNSYTGSVLETNIYGPVNSMITGGWFSNCPTIQSYLEKYLGDAKDGIHFLIYADGNQKTHPSLVYLEEEMDVEAVLVDQFTASHGGSYSIYYLEGNFTFSNR